MKAMRKCHTNGIGRLSSRTLPQRYVRPLLGGLALLLLLVGTSHAQTRVHVGPHEFTRLCPTHVGGDREYSGNGPEVHAYARLAITGSDTELRACFFMHQMETKHDWSEALLDDKEDDECFLLYTAPVGMRITRILNDTRSDIRYIDSDHGLDKFFPTGNLVREFQIKGDTKGKDIGNCTADDAYLNVFLEDVEVELERLMTM
jgi:hypothetical protein